MSSIGWLAHESSLSLSRAIPSRWRLRRLHQHKLVLLNEEARAQGNMDPEREHITSARSNRAYRFNNRSKSTSSTAERNLEFQSSVKSIRLRIRSSGVAALSMRFS